jgi:hypothetical protein
VLALRGLLWKGVKLTRSEPYTAYYLGAGALASAFGSSAGGVAAAGGKSGAMGAVALDAGMPPVVGSGITAFVAAFGTDKSIDLVGSPSLVVPSSITEPGPREPWLPKTVNVKDVKKNAPARIVVVRVMKVVAERPDIMLEGPPPMPSAPPPSDRCNKIAPIKKRQINKWIDNRIGMMLWIMGRSA